MPSAEIESYEDLRPYLTPALFEGLKPHVEEFQRRIAAGETTPGPWTLPDGAAPSGGAVTSPWNSLQAVPAAQTYEDLRPHLSPALFEGLKPHVEEFQRRLAARWAASQAPARPVTPEAQAEPAPPYTAQPGLSALARPSAPLPQDALSTTLASFQAPNRAEPNAPLAIPSPFDPSPPLPPLVGGAGISSDLFIPLTSPPGSLPGPPAEDARAPDLAGPLAPASATTTSTSQEAPPGDAYKLTDKPGPDPTQPREMASGGGQQGHPLPKTEMREAQGTGGGVQSGPLAVRAINANGHTAAHSRTPGATYYDANGHVQATTVQNTDGNQTATRQEFAQTIPALPKAVDADVTLPAAFAGARNVRQYDLDGIIPAGSLGPQADGTVGVLAYAYRGQHWSKGSQAVPVVGDLSKATVDAICTAYDAVQNLTTSTYQAVAASPGMRPQQIGTTVHRIIETIVEGWPPTSFATFSGNVGLMGKRGRIKGARVAGSSWLDVLQDNGNNTVCVYDIKTGNATLQDPQASRYLDEVRKFKQNATDIIVIEVKP